MAGRGTCLLLVLLHMGVTKLQATNIDRVPLIMMKLNQIKTQYIENNLNTTGLENMAKQIALIDKNQGEGRFREIKVEKVGAAVNGLLDFFTSLGNGEFKTKDGGKKAAVSIIKLLGRFAEIGGTFLPPPAGTAITVGFGTINSLMSLIGVVPKAPSMKEVMTELLDEQTEEIRNMFEDLKEESWNDLMDEADGEIAEFVVTHMFLRIAIRTKFTEKDLSAHPIDILQGEKFLTKLGNRLDKLCTNINKKNEDRCLLILEYFSRISIMRSSQFEMIIEVYGVHYDKLLIAHKANAKRALENMKEILKKTTGEENNSAICVKTKIAYSSENKFLFTKSAMKLINQSYELSETEKTIASMICPSATKLMLIAGNDGDNWNSVELVSPFNNSPGTLPVLPEWRDDWPMASVYTTRQGEKRVMVCGGDYSVKFLGYPGKKCWSSNGGDWVEEKSLPDRLSSAGMASINTTSFVLGGRQFTRVRSYGSEPVSTILESYEGKEEGEWFRTGHFVSPVAGPQCTISWGNTLYTVDRYKVKGAHYASVNEQWHTLPSPPHEAHRCTVAIISVTPVWVISEQNGGRISYLPLPHTPGSQWMSLPDLPGSCACVGWSEGRLICAEDASKKILYYDEKTWKTAPRKMQKIRKGNAYANVPGSW